jgi:23S rRNA (guanosine2251-2'-O)-methyltransferase
MAPDRGRWGPSSGPRPTGGAHRRGSRPPADRPPERWAPGRPRCGPPYGQRGSRPEYSQRGPANDPDAPNQGFGRRDPRFDPRGPSDPRFDPRGPRADPGRPWPRAGGPQRPYPVRGRPDQGPVDGPPPYERPAPRPPFRGGPPPPRSSRPWVRPGFEPAPWPRPAESLPQPDLLGPDEELVAGRRPVEEVFAAGRTAYRLLVVPQRRNALEQVVLHATRLRIPIVEVEGGSLTAVAGFDGHQGVALVVEPRRFASLDDILARAAERSEPPFVLVLDSLEDPQNVGTLLRSAEAAGIHGIVFPTRRQAPLSPAAVKASAGAVEHLLLCPVDDLAGALADLHSHGLRIAGSEADAPLTARQTDLRGPLAIVVGSEGQGLGPAVRRRCDLFMRIPMRGAIGSLNAAVAGSVLLFEAVAQREPGPGQPVMSVEADPAPPEPPSSATTPARDVEDSEAAADAPAVDPVPVMDDDLLPGGPTAPATPKPKKARAPRTPRA